VDQWDGSADGAHHDGNVVGIGSDGTGDAGIVELSKEQVNDHCKEQWGKRATLANPYLLSKSCPAFTCKA